MNCLLGYSGLLPVSQLRLEATHRAMLQDPEGSEADVDSAEHAPAPDRSWWETDWYKDWERRIEPTRQG